MAGEQEPHRPAALPEPCLRCLTERACACVRAQVWVQQNKTIWRENRNLKDQLPYLSPEVVELLDGMFELDEKKRRVVMEEMESIGRKWKEMVHTHTTPHVRAHLSSSCWMVCLSWTRRRGEW